MRAINDCQALTIQQLMTLFWNSPNPAYTRLRQLVKYGYLEKCYITQIRAAPAASPMVLTLTRQGAAVLAETFGYDTEDFNFASRQIENWKTFQPIRATNDIRVALMRACWEDEHFTLVEWRNEARFRSKPRHVYIEGKKKPVYPDGYCLVRQGRRMTYNFVEADNGTEGLKQFMGQMAVYQAYVDAGLYQEDFGTRFWRVLVVTTGDKRLENLRRKVIQVGGGGRNYLFTTYDRISPQTILSAPIWRMTRGDEMYTFFAEAHE